MARSNPPEVVTIPEMDSRRASWAPDEKAAQNIDGRLSRIEGQIRGIRSMHTEGRSCIDKVTQIAAVRAALKKVADALVAEHVRDWVRAKSLAGNRQEDDIEDLLKVFNQYYR